MRDIKYNIKLHISIFKHISRNISRLNYYNVVINIISKINFEMLNIDFLTVSFVRDMLIKDMLI